MSPLPRILTAAFLLLLARPVLAADEPKDSIVKGKDGWYAVEFQVGTGKFKVEFPGEPKLESDPKAADERLYSFTNPKTGRRYFLRATDGYHGSILPEADPSTNAAEGIFNKWKKDDPRYKTVDRARRGTFGKTVAWEITLDEGKTKGWSHQYLLIQNGCFIHLGSDKTATDAEEKRFLTSIVVEKGEAPPIEATKVEPPAGWKEYAVGKTGLSVWAPVELKYNFRSTGGAFGDHGLGVKEGTKALFEIKIQHVKDTKEFDGLKPTVFAAVPTRAAKVTIGGVAGICTFKDGKPVGKDPKFSYSAFVGNFYVNVRCVSDLVSPSDAEKVAILIVQQLREKAANP